jgi:hypothetical protein
MLKIKKLCFFFLIRVEISNWWFVHGKKIRHGQFGEVWEGLWNKTPVAIKTLKTGKFKLYLT